MSPRAACRLETLGFEHVYDYVTGKSDWRARGLSLEGEAVEGSRVVDFVCEEVATCGLADRIRAVREQVRSSPFEFAFVVSAGGVLLGLLRAAALEGDPAIAAETVMEPGPSTVRANAPLAQVRQRMERRDLTTAVVTDPEGHLVGVVRPTDLPVDG
jgi:CBS domain-containing protein